MSIETPQSPLTQEISRAITIPAGRTRLHGHLSLPPDSKGIVLFAHGSGSSRHSPRNQFVARVIRDVDLGTLLFDLLTPAEESEDIGLSFVHPLIESIHLFTNVAPRTSVLRVERPAF